MANPERPFLSVIVPVFNEEKTVGTILEKTLAAAGELAEVIVVDDGSTDATPRILAKFSRRKRIKLITLPRNRGKGFALRQGFQAAKGEVFLIQDADLEYNPDDYRRLLLPIREGKTEVVYGSRLARYPLTLKTLLSIPLPLNFLANKGLGFLTYLLYGVKLTDIETGYKAFRREVYEKLELQKDGFEIEVELTAKILLKGIPILEIPIETKPRNYDEGKKIIWTDGVEAFFWLIKYRFASGS